MARIKTHPGEILLEDFINPAGLTRNAVAKDIDLDPKALNRICACEAAVTSEVAIRLAEYFGTSPELWINLQSAHDLSKAEAERGKELRRRVRARKAGGKAEGKAARAFAVA